MKKQTFFIVALMALWATCLHAQELIPYRKGDKWGFCTPDKKMVVQPKYDVAWSFSKGLARVKLNGKYFYIKIFPDGKIVEYYEK